MSDRPFRATAASSRRTTGLLIAAATLLIFAGIILFVAIGHGSGESPSSATPSNVVDIGKAPTTIGGSDPTQIQDTGAARLQFVDKDDPNRLASELSYDKLNPVGPGYYTLDQPRAWVYMKDGRILHIRADGGRVRMPSKVKQPESGEFRGNVIVRMFAPPPAHDAGARPVDAEHDMPALVALADSVSFDSVLLELSTPDVVTVTAPNLHFEGEGLLVRANQVQERIELLRTKGRFVRYNPKIKTERAGGAKPVDEKTVARGAESEKVVAGKPSGEATAHAEMPGGADVSAKDGDAPGTVVASTTTPAPAPAKGPHKEQLYKAVFSDAVTVTETTRRLNADTLEVFTRLIDNHLPDNAFGTQLSTTTQPAAPNSEQPAPARPGHPGTNTGASNSQTAAVPSTAASNTSMASSAVPVASPTNLFQSAGDEDIVLRWTGNLVLTPIVEGPTPRELDEGNHFFARFSADKPGGQSLVTVTDSSREARGECAEIEYAATSRTLSLLSGPNAPSVVFNSQDAGQLVVPNARVSLLTGLAHVKGQGQLTAYRSDKTFVGPPDPAAANKPIPADSLRQITWTDSADYQFRLAEGKLTSALDWAEFTGSVLARDRTSAVSGDFLRADFGPVGTQASALKRLKVKGNALAVAPQKAYDPSADQPPSDPYLSAESIEVGFAPSTINPNDVDPVRGVAQGSVRASDQTATLRAPYVEADLARNSAKAMVATSIVAKAEDGSAGVQVDRTDGVSARCDDLRARPVLRTAMLIGQTVALARGNSTILCREAELDDAAQTMHVYGAGTFDHLQLTQQAQLVDGGTEASATPPPPEATKIHAQWTRSMLFDNNHGTLDMLGKAEVTSAAALETRALHAEKLHLWMTPASEAGSHHSASAPPAQPGELVIGDNRKLLRVEAIGASEDREGDAMTSVQIRRYASPLPPEAEPTLTQVFYIDGPRIIADEVAGTVTVPTAGRCMTLDQRAATASDHLATSTGVPLSNGNGSARGKSMFKWAESMEFTRATGVLTMKKDVELVHRPLGAQDVTRLVAQQIDAKFNMDKTTTRDSADKRSAELVRADATGSVYAENGQQRLLADTFGYDALGGTADAGAAGNNRVTLYDDRKGTQLVARRLFWDLVHDRVEIREPAPMSAPR